MSQPMRLRVSWKWVWEMKQSNVGFSFTWESAILWRYSLGLGLLVGMLFLQWGDRR